jgi:hypothetical protein
MRFPRPLIRLRLPLLFLALLGTGLLTSGCAQGPVFIPPGQRKVIDRSIVDYPGGTILEEVVTNLTGPCDCEVDSHGNLIVAESGAGGREPRIFGIRPNGSIFTIYPLPRTFRVPFDVAKFGYVIYGPLGGIALGEGDKVYVSHRDSKGFGAVTAFGYDGSHTTITSNLPCQGDNGMSDVALGRGRLWFGVGSATNSGVVGLDNWRWVKQHPDFCDRSFVDLKLLGFHFKSPNPDAGLFGGPDVAVTAPFQPFNVSAQTRIRKSEYPSAAIYSADPLGGGARVEASGIRCPRGLAFSAFENLYFTNGGMELRGTRPIKDDPDALLSLASGAWYGFPDYAANLQPVTAERFQPPAELQIGQKTGYDEVSFLIDHNASNNSAGLIPPDPTLLQATFPSLSGAGLLDFVPNSGPLKQYAGNMIVPLMGDRAPFATSGMKLLQPVGFKVVRVDPTSREVKVTDFIRNTKGKPASLLPGGQGLLERPIAVKFAPDGSMYVVDFGRMTVGKDGRIKVKPGTGKILRLAALPATKGHPASSEPTSQAKAKSKSAGKD